MFANNTLCGEAYFNDSPRDDLGPAVFAVSATMEAANDYLKERFERTCGVSHP